MEDIFITKIHINNVRHLHEIDIPIDSSQMKHLIVTGKNGSGKTSLLVAISHYLQSIPDINFRLKQNWEKLVSTNLDFSAHESAESEKASLRYEAGAIVQFNQPDNIQDLYNSSQFIIAFFQANRFMSPEVPKGISKIEPQNAYSISENAGIKFTQHLVNLKAQRSFANDDNDDETIIKIDDWFRIFEESLRDIFDDINLKLIFDRENYNFKIHQTGKDPFDFNTLADGYSAILYIITELMFRMEKNKQKGYDVNGIVLIDEIETHLHVELQKKILPFLTGFFPNIQFVVTTHSPFVINSLSNAVIYDLENRIQVEDLSGYPYDGLIESFFNIDKYSENIKNKINTYDILVKKENPDDSDLEQMLDLRNYLKQIPADLAPELASRFAEIELARKARGNNGKRS